MHCKSDANLTMFSGLYSHKSTSKSLAQVADRKTEIRTIQGLVEMKALSKSAHKQKTIKCHFNQKFNIQEIFRKARPKPSL